MRIVRILVFLFITGGLLALLIPLLFASIYVDRHGIPISGRVRSKQETIRVRDSTWTRTCELSIEYTQPEDGGGSLLNTHVEPERFDKLRAGQSVTLNYLRRQDWPELPMAHFLGEIRLMPIARLEGQTTFSALQSFGRRHQTMLLVIAGTVVILLLWRNAGLPRFGWAVGVCVLLGIGVILVNDFPTPERPPTADVRRVLGRVKSVDRIDRLFYGTHTEGFNAAQPVDVAGVEFVPEGRTDPVVAVDLIDAGSVAGLGVGSAVSVEYERESPRTAYIRDATRTFPQRNLHGIAMEGLLVLLVIAGLLTITRNFDRWFSRKKSQ